MSLTHQQIDRRSLAFYRIIVYLIEHDSSRHALLVAKTKVNKWMKEHPERLTNRMWFDILNKPWNEAKKCLLEKSDKMQYLRQASPFAGEECIPNNIRMRIIKKYYSRAEHEQSAS